MKSFLVCLLNLVSAGFQLEGCYDTFQVTAVTNNSPLPMLTLDLCSTLCIMESFRYALLDQKHCYCVNSLSGFEERNDSECDLNCPDISASKCGGSSRVSGYVLSAPAKVSTAPQVSEPTGVTNGTLGKGDANNDRQIALYASLCAAVVLVIVGVILVINRKRRLNQIPTLPRLFHLSKNEKYLLPGLLPQTTNMIYYVVTPYAAQREDELNLKGDDVVAVRQWNEQGWAVGTLVDSGEKGYFPLITLVARELVNGEVTIPPRDQLNLRIDK